MTSTLQADPWKALGVERNADKAEIRTAYKKLVLKCHPDKIQDPTLKALKADEFQKVQQAWELLNDDAEKAKYEQKLRLAELQRAAKVQQDVKNPPNTSVPRTAKYATFDIHPAEPTSRYKGSPTAGKVYTYTTTTHARSYEEMPSTRIYTEYEDVDKKARRAPSYEKPPKRDDERRERDREERRRWREDEALRLREKEREREREKDREREREREKEKERERKAEKKRLEREREKEREKARKRDADDKARQHKPYVEHYDAGYLDIEGLILEDEKYVTSTSKSDKKRSSSRKHDETRERERERDRDRERDREREKSSSRRTKSPRVIGDRKHIDLYDYAASYLANRGTAAVSQKAAFWMSETPPETAFIAPTAPTPPPADFIEEESIRLSASRAAGRRASNDAARSREKLKYDVSDDTPTKVRPIPTLSKSYSTPPSVPESPPRVTRSKTAPHEPSYRAVPSLPRTQTWAPGTKSAAEYYDEIESDDDRDRRRHRSRRTRSPSGQATQRYKVSESLKTSKIEPQYSYGESPSSTRRYATDMLDGHVAHSPSSATYPSSGGFRVKHSKTFGPDDVTYAQYEHPSSYNYSSHLGDGYVATA